MSSLPAQSSTSSAADPAQPNSSGGPALLDRSFAPFTSSASANASSSVKSESSTVYLASQPDPSSHAQPVQPVGTPPGSDTPVSPGSDDSDGASSRSASSRPHSSGEQASASGLSDHVSSDKKGQARGTVRETASRHVYRIVTPCLLTTSICSCCAALPWCAGKKNVREKRRRSELNTKFDTLRDLLHMGERKQKVEKTHILSEAIYAITQFRKKQSELAMHAKLTTPAYAPVSAYQPVSAQTFQLSSSAKVPTAGLPAFQLPQAPILTASLSGGEHASATLLQQMAMARQQPAPGSLVSAPFSLHPSQLAAAQQQRLSSGSPGMSPVSGSATAPRMIMSPTPAPGPAYYQPQQQSTPATATASPYLQHLHAQPGAVQPGAAAGFSPFPGQLSSLPLSSLSHAAFSSAPPTFSSSTASLPLNASYPMQSMSGFYPATSSSSVSLFQSQPQLLAQQQQQQQQQHLQQQQQQLHHQLHHHQQQQQQQQPGPQ